MKQFHARKLRKDAVEAKQESGLMRAPKLNDRGLRHRAQTGLRLFGNVREHHRNMIAGVLVARAGNHHAGAMDLAVIARRL